tara:strand:+ start:616 stop:1998 length:1383 start_codon:yes stop_codon:yes gene_type:complete
MTDITIDLNKSEGFVVSPSERSSDWVAAFLSYNHLLAALGTADERSLGYMLLTSPTDLYSRLSATYDVGWYINSGETDGDDAVVYNNETPDKYNANNPTEANWVNGPDFNIDGTPTGFGFEFWSVANYLSYGGNCFVAGAPDNLPTTENNGKETIENTTKTINCVYTTSTIRNNDIIDIAEKRGDCMAICQVDVKAPVSSTTPEGLPASGTQSRNTFHVAGQKVHLGTSSSLTTGNDTNSSLITTGVAADVAGCMARVRSSTNRFQSPAGTGPGALLDVVRMEYDLTATDRAELANNFVNPIRTFEGIGSVLFGDRTGNSNVSENVFNYTNASLTYLHINRLISDVIRQYMFRENMATTRASVTSEIQSILRRIVAGGGLSEYSVICDETNNPESIILAGNLIIDVTLKFVLSIQNITLRFRTLSGDQTTQSPASSSGSGGSSSSTSSTSSTSSSGGSSY